MPEPQGREPTGINPPAQNPEPTVAPLEFQARRQHLQQLLDRHRRLFMTHAKRLNLQFAAGDHFGIDAQSGVVVFDANWFAAGDFSDDEIKWMVLQQVGRIRDVSEDARGYQERLQFEAKQGSYQKLHRAFREGMDQVYQYFAIQRAFSNFDPGTPADQGVRSLIGEKLNPQDLRHLPKHAQFLHGVIRRSILPNEEALVDPDVDESLRLPLDQAGKSFNIEQIIHRFIKPRGNRDTSLKTRLAHLSEIEKRYLDFVEEDRIEQSKGKLPTEDMDSDLATEEQDEYFPQDMESMEGGSKTPYIFKIDPGEAGNYRGGVRTFFDPETRRWHKRKTLTPYDEACDGAARTYQGKVRGLVSLPLPPGRKIDRTSLSFTGTTPPELFRDQFGNFYAQSSELQRISFRYGRAGFEENVDHAPFAVELFSVELSGPTEAKLKEVASLATPEERADELVHFMHEKYTYNVSAQGKLYRAATSVDDYFHRIDAAEQLECYTSNTFFVGLCRKVDVVARLCTGHHVGKLNTQGQAEITRNTGHAYSEIWNGSEWVEKDATPPAQVKEVEQEMDLSNIPDVAADEELMRWHEAQQTKNERPPEPPAPKRDPLEYLKHRREKMDQAWAANHQVDPEKLKAFRSLEDDVNPYIGEFSNVWDRIIYSAQRTQVLERTGHFQTGEAMDLQKAIEEYPSIRSGRLQDVQLMERLEPKEGLVRRPERIRVRMIGDKSGSMEKEHRIPVLRKCFATIQASLREFNLRLNLTRDQTGSGLAVDSEGWLLGTTPERIKSFRGDRSLDDEFKEEIEMIDKIRYVQMEWTYGGRVLEKIHESLTAEDVHDIQTGKLMELVFLVTDGGDMDEAGIRKEIDELTAMGVIVRGFQIGVVEEEEQANFHRVWNQGRERPYGEVVGSNIANLLPAVTNSMSAFFKEVRI